MQKKIPFFLLLIASVSCVFAAPYSINALQATPTIDGVLSTNEWSEKQAVKLSRAYHDQRIIKLYYAHDDQYLYLAADVKDQQLWADGSGNGTGNIWESYQDDSIEWYFDLNQSKEDYLQSSDRFLSLNIGNFTDPVNGSGIVSRRSFNAGNGKGGATGIIDPYTFDGIHYKVSYRGTVNNPTDVDEGYSIEVAIPWRLLPHTAHTDGNSIGINAIVISDDAGSTRDFSDNRSINSATQRFTLAVLPDEYVELKHSPLHSSQSGLNGPVAYTTLRFQDKADSIPPAPVANLVAAHPRPYSLRLQWNNPGDNNNFGVAAGFEIRYSSQKITDTTFNQATLWPFNKKENFDYFATTNIRVMGLHPNTTYYFAVRAYDEVNNYSAISYTAPVKTNSLAAHNTAIPVDKYQGLIAVAPGGRYFIKENGQAIIPIGTHYLPQDDAIRYLYNGAIWTGNQCHNFTKNPEADKKVADYMVKLKASGITVMRLFLEDLSLNVPNNGAFNQQNCAYWLESPQGNFNPKMADFIIKILRLSAENGIYVLISPFDTFYYDQYLARLPWHASQGGPLTDINQFFKSPDVLAMAKSRWQWVINTVNNSGYGDVVFGYEIMNEWDSFEWTKPAADHNTDAKIRQVFMEKLANYVRKLDGEHLILSSSTALDPRGALGSFIYDSNTFDAVLPHLYLPGNREPWNNPTQHVGAAVVREQANILSWWTANQSHAKPVLNGEWGPSDGWLPNPENPGYFSAFTEADDELITRKLWFTELASGAAGPGIRMPGGVRGGSKLGLHLSDKMFKTAKILSAFVNTRTGTGVNFTDFTGENLQGSIKISPKQTSLIVTGTGDDKQGLLYIHQDKNKSSGKINNASLTISDLPGGAALQAEFWKTSGNQTQAQQVVMANTPTLSAPNDSRFLIPVFNDDWMIKYYEKFSTRLKIWREQGQHVIGLEYKNMQNAGPVDVYVVYQLKGQFFSLIQNASGQVSSVLGIAPLKTNINLSNGIDELARLAINENIKVNIYVATLSAGTPVESATFKTLQFSEHIF